MSISTINKIKNVHPNVMSKEKLSEEQKRFYWENGYLVVKELIDFGTLYACKQRFQKMCIGEEDPGQILVVKELALIGKEKGEKLINKFQDILYDEIFSLYSEHPALLVAIGDLVNSDHLVAIHSMFINKPPGTTGHPVHQDLYYFPYRPADNIVAAWTAIDDVTTQNGCLYVVPGSHRHGVLYDHGYPNQNGKTNAMYHGILDEEKVSSARVQLEMSPGDTVFFHPLLLHGSGPNHSQSYRKCITVHYASDTHCYPIELSGTNQETIAKEVEEVAKRKGFQISYLDIWRAKSKGVKGVRSHL